MAKTAKDGMCGPAGDSALDPARHLLVVGIHQRSVSAALRERLFGEEPDPSALIARAREAGLRDALVLATCERIEVLAVELDVEATGRILLGLLAEEAGVGPGELEPQSYRHQGEAALRHLFAVAASLDSQLIGEPQILGQVKESHRRAVEAGLAGSALQTLLMAAIGAAKRVRSETPVAERPVSISASALQVARDVHGDLSRRGALLVGLGEMGEYMAAELIDAGIGDLVVVHTSLVRAEAVAHRLGCHFRSWEELEAALSSADIVVTAMGTGRYTVTAKLAEAALKRRRREAIFMIDAALPCDIDPAVAELDGAFVYDLEDLERVALQGRATREAAIAAAWSILDEELAAFQRLRAERAAVPSVAALRRHFDAVRDEVLADGRLSAEEATRRLVNRLLHDPSEALRQAAAAARGHPDATQALEDALDRLFRLGGSPGSDSAGAGETEDTT